MLFQYMTVVGLGTFLITYVMIDMAAFKKNIWWGFGSIIPLVGIAFAYLNFSSIKKTLYANLAGIAMLVTGYGMVEGF